MTPSPAHLRVVDAHTGEVVENVILERLQAELDETTRKLRGAWLQIRKLERDVENEQREHPKHNDVVALFTAWRELCRHPRAKLDYGPSSRFAALLWGLEKYGEEKCLLALRGASYDPWTKRARNGHVERYDDVTTVFKNAASVERFCNRAPRERAAA